MGPRESSNRGGEAFDDSGLRSWLSGVPSDTPLTGY